MGIALPRRLVASAVQRNRIKRIVRELFRRHGAKHAGLDLVVSLRGAWKPADERAFVREVQELMDRVRGATA